MSMREANFTVNYDTTIWWRGHVFNIEMSGVTILQFLQNE